MRTRLSGLKNGLRTMHHHLDRFGICEGRERLFDTPELIFGDHASQHPLKTPFAGARENILPAVGSQHARMQPRDVLLKERTFR